MERLEINKSEVEGIVFTSGSKNIALPLIFSSLLTRGKQVLENVPDIDDVRVSLAILEHLNVKTNFSNNRLIIDTSDFIYSDIPFSLINKLRASYYALGVLIPQVKQIVFTYPGGCSFQSRPINYHLDGFKKLKVVVSQEGDKIILNNEKLVSGKVTLPSLSVGATINFLLLMVQLKEKSIIENPSLDYEVKEVIRYLKKLGFYIEISVNKIIIYGNHIPSEINYFIPYDRIEIGSFSLLGAMTNRLLIIGINQEAIASLIKLFNQIKIKYLLENNYLLVEKSNINYPLTITLSNDPFLPTDLGPLLCAFLLTNNQISIIEDKIYPYRNSYVNQLIKMGAKIRVINNKIIIFPHSVFNESEVKGEDLRGTMSLLLGAILSKKRQVLSGLEYLNRGYENILEKLTNINVKIRRINE